MGLWLFMRILRVFYLGFAVVFVLVLALGLVTWLYGAELFDKQMNRVVADPTAPVPTAEDRRFHRSLLIADLHADTLKWERDLLARSAWGHVDLPRLVEGNVGLQVFTIVTKSPVPQARPGFPGQTCVSGSNFNVAAALAAVQGRPVFSERQRALHQIRRFKRAVERSKDRPGPELRLITDAEDLRRLVADRRAGKQVVGGILGIEGGHWIGDPEGPVDSVDAEMRELYELGVRQFAPTHRFDNALSGASEGCKRGGLTPLGARALESAERLGMMVDLAHISSQGLRDALAVLERPFVISHTGVQAGCESPCRPARNLSEEDLALVLANQGLIGVGYWPEAVGPTIWRIVDVMSHIMGVSAELGLDPGRHVALGSDYDGSVVPYFDTSELAILTAMMRQRPGVFDPPTIRAIAGLNTCRHFAQVLPGGSAELADSLCEPPAPQE